MKNQDFSILLQNQLLDMIQHKKCGNELAEILGCGKKTQQYGLILTPEEAKELIISRNDSLKRFKRVSLAGECSIS